MHQNKRSGGKYLFFLWLETKITLVKFSFLLLLIKKKNKWKKSKRQSGNKGRKGMSIYVCNTYIRKSFMYFCMILHDRQWNFFSLNAPVLFLVIKECRTGVTYVIDI